LAATAPAPVVVAPAPAPVADWTQGWSGQATIYAWIPAINGSQEGPDGSPIDPQTQVGSAVDADGAGDSDSDVANLIEQPAKVMRIGSMIKQLLEEVRAAPLDEASRTRLREIHERSIKELEDGLAPELQDELERLSLPFEGDAPPSESELRIAQAQLVGWLEGLFHGIQTALFAQQMAARAQLEQMRRALPQGPVPPTSQPEGRQREGTGGMYL
jgi:hypothetical protein